MSEKQTAKEKELWIEAVLSNDEASSDAELVEHFIANGLTEKEAKVWVGRRSFYLCNIVMTCEFCGKKYTGRVQDHLKGSFECAVKFLEKHGDKPMTVTITGRESE